MRHLKPNNHGIGLLAMVIVIAVAGLLIAGSIWQLANQSAQIQLQIDQTKAHYLAQAGVMRAIRNWYNISVNSEIARTAAPINTTVTGNQIFKVGYESNGSSILQSNYAYIVPGIAFVKNVGTVTNTTSNTSMTLTIGAGVSVPVGNFLVVSLAMDANGTNPVVNTGVANQDSKGNVYTRHINLSSANTNAVPRLAVFSAPITTALVAGDTITMTWTTNTTAKAMTVAEFSGVDTYHIASTTGTGTSTAPVSGNAVTTIPNTLLVGAIAVEGIIGDTFTAGTNYITNPPTRAATALALATDNSLINPEYRLVSAAGTYTASGTITNRDWAAGVVAFYPNAANRWFVSGADRRLRQWQVYNRHASTSITLDKVKISWSPAGSELLNDFVLNGVSKWPGGTAANGATVDITDTVLTAGSAWSGNTTYIQWNGAVNGGGNVTVTCQFIFSGDTTTTDAKTHEVVMWDGAQTGEGMPMARSWTVTSTGQVNQTQGTNNFKVLETIKAQVSGAPATAAAPAVPQVEITQWDEGDKNIP